jgi:hypothetical protein
MRFNGGDEDVGKYGRDIGRKTSISMLNNNRIKKLVTNKTVFPKKRIVVGWEACYFKGARRTPKEVSNQCNESFNPGTAYLGL